MHAFTGAGIFNLYETGVTTVPKTRKVVATKGQHQVGERVPHERGELVTQVGIIGANEIAPNMGIPEKKNGEHRMLSDIPEEYGATSSFVWMDNE